MTLNELFAALDGLPAAPTLQQLVRILRRLRVPRDELRRMARFGQRTYRRNLLHAASHYQALALCWRSGQRSPIHDHRGSACAVRVLAGLATEVIFARSAAGLIYPVRTRALPQASVCASFDADVHQMGNLQAAGNDLITLHIYAPPLLEMRIYSLGESATGGRRATRRIPTNRWAIPRGATSRAVRRARPLAARG